jgi:hypothetical protein
MFRHPRHRMLYREILASRVDGVPAPRMYDEVIRYGSYEDEPCTRDRWKPRRVLRHNSKARKAERRFKQSFIHKETH